MSYIVENAVYPKMYRVKQRMNDEKITDIPAEVFKQLDAIGMREAIQPNAQIGVCSGSRGINNIAVIVRAVCDYVRSCNAKPFIVPAMGSHGGATAEGQKHVSEKFGVSEEAMGCEIRSSMETIQFEDTEYGTPVYFDKIAYESDGVIVIKPSETSYRFYGR